MFEQLLTVPFAKSRLPGSRSRPCSPRASSQRGPCSLHPALTKRRAVNKYVLQAGIFSSPNVSSIEQGAKTIAEYLLETYGEDYFSLIVDEGGEYMFVVVLQRACR